MENKTDHYDYFLCMALDCKKKVYRHPYNFDTGFCETCQKKRDESIDL